MYTYLCSFKTSPYLANSVPLLRFDHSEYYVNYSKMSKCKGWSIPQKSLVASSSLIRVTLSSCEVSSLYLIIRNVIMTRSIMNEILSWFFSFWSLITPQVGRVAHLHFFSSSRVFLSNLFIAPFTHSRHLCARGKKIAVVQKRV